MVFFYKEEMNMKKLTKLTALFLSLVLAVSMLSVTAVAAESGSNSESTSGTSQPITTTVVTQAIHFKDSSMTDVQYTYSHSFTIKEDYAVDGGFYGYFPVVYGQMYEFAGVSVDKVPNDGGKHVVQYYFIPHVHNYRIGYNRTHHWEACRCGSTLMYETHVDPAKDEDSICTCGYKFSDNAGLVMLNLSDIVLKDHFTWEQTEYLADVFTYKPVTSTVIKCRTGDSFATVDAPATVEIKEGMNVIKITVTAEDKKTTQTYTVYANLASQVNGIVVSNILTDSGECATFITQPAVDKNCIATLAVTSEALADKLAFQANSCESKRIIIEPTYNKWAVETVHVPMSAAVLEKLAETKADLVIQTYSGNIVVPNSELAALAKEGEMVDFGLTKNEEGTASIILSIGDKRVENANISLEK